MSKSSKSVPPVHLPESIVVEIVAHAREGKPKEVCGIFRGQGLTAFELVRGQNIADDPIQNYEVDPQTLLRQFEFEDAGDEMMGIYHSHPVSVAYPSATDAWNAHYPDSIYFICSLEHDEPVLRAFSMHTQYLDQESLERLTDLPFYETRPSLFAYYQSEDTLLPPILEHVVGELPLPFYVVYFKSPDSGRQPEVRAVTILEHDIVSE